MTALASLLTVAALASGPELAGSAASAARLARAEMLDTTRDVVVERAFVPSERRPQGEVRVVQRGNRVVVQTLLYTRMLQRVVATIGDKERRNWPAGAPGHDDMELYLRALEELRATAEQSDVESDGRVHLLIEFVDAPDASCVALGSVDLDRAEEEAVRIRERFDSAILNPSAVYMRRNMRLIVADAFHMSLDEAEALLARARP